LVEEEERHRPHLERASRGRDSAQLALVRAAQPELDDHGVVCVVQRNGLVALVRKRRTRLREVRGHRLLAVVNLTGGDDLVAGVVEGPQRHVELVTVLGLHVLANKPFATLAELRRRHYWSFIAALSETANSTRRSSSAWPAGPWMPC